MCRHTTPPACYLKYLHEGHGKGSLQGSLKNKDMVLLHMYLSMKNWDAVSAVRPTVTGQALPLPAPATARLRPVHRVRTHSSRR